MPQKRNRPLIKALYYVLSVLGKCKIIPKRTVRSFAFKHKLGDEYIISSGFFDVEFYNRECSGNYSPEEGLRHYFSTGWKMGLDPSEKFCTEYYLHRNVDVRNSGMNPLLHFLLFGESEGRDAVVPWQPETYRLISKSDLFDSDWYSRKYCSETVIDDAVLHYCHEGCFLGYSPSRYFSGVRYMQAYPDIKENPLIHWLKYGCAEANRMIFKEGIIESIIRYPENFSTGNSNTGINILLVSNPLDHTGAPIALLNLGRLLKEEGNCVYILAAEGGDLESDILQAGIPIIIDPTILLPKEATKLPIRFDFCVCNTVVMWAAYRKLSTKIPTIWWIHDNVRRDDINMPRMIAETLEKADRLYVVPSKRTISCMQTFNPRITLMPYPVLDMAEQIDYYATGKPKFAIIGRISQRKAQDIFIEAVRELPSRVRKQAEFEIIGYDPYDEFSRSVRADANDCHEITFHDPMLDCSTYHKYLDIVDVICCVSREDPLPIVVTEGLMHGAIPIVTTAVGQSTSITDGLNGYVIKTNCHKDLSNIMRLLIENPGQIAGIQRKSRELFEGSFCNHDKCRQLIDAAIAEARKNFGATENSRIQ